MRFPKWVILALWKITDYKASRGEDYSQYMVGGICSVEFHLISLTSPVLSQYTTWLRHSGITPVEVEVGLHAPTVPTVPLLTCS